MGSEEFSLRNSRNVKLDYRFVFGTSCDQILDKNNLRRRVYSGSQFEGAVLNGGAGVVSEPCSS